MIESTMGALMLAFILVGLVTRSQIGAILLSWYSGGRLGNYGDLVRARPMFVDDTALA